jgi:CRISPR-associated exonuclease Cas4
VPHAFSELATAAYCPRQCYYARRSGDVETVPDGVEAVRELAFRYGELLDADDAALRAAPIEVSPVQFRRNLGCARARLDRFADLVDPSARGVYLRGRDAHGVAHKLLAGDEETPPTPSLVSAGSPPEQGVYEPQSVRAVAAAKALAHERERPVERALYEFPAHGVVRRVELTTRRKAAYRRTVRALSSMDGPPPRVDDDAKCDACQYREECGVKTRSLRSMLGL